MELTNRMSFCWFERHWFTRSVIISCLTAMRSAGFKAFTISRSNSAAFLILFKPSKLNNKIERKRVIVMKSSNKRKGCTSNKPMLQKIVPQCFNIGCHSLIWTSRRISRWTICLMYCGWSKYWRSIHRTSWKHYSWPLYSPQENTISAGTIVP